MNEDDIRMNYAWQRQEPIQEVVTRTAVVALNDDR